jgi:hypothetical protein
LGAFLSKPSTQISDYKTLTVLFESSPGTIFLIASACSRFGKAGAFVGRAAGVEQPGTGQ